MFTLFMTVFGFGGGFAAARAWAKATAAGLADTAGKAGKLVWKCLKK